MTKPVFMINDVFQKSWSRYSKHIGFLIGVAVLAWLALAIPFSIHRAVSDVSAFLGYIFFAAFLVIKLLVLLGLTRISLDITDGKESAVSNLYSLGYLLWPLFLASLVFFIVVDIGFILLIVPGVIWGIQFSFYVYFIVDKELAPIEALRASSKLTDGARWDLFLLYLAFFVFNLLGALLFGIGLLLTVPMTLLAHAHVYRLLLRRKRSL